MCLCHVITVLYLDKDMYSIDKHMYAVGKHMNPPLKITVEGMPRHFNILHALIIHKLHTIHICTHTYIIHNTYHIDVCV